jgi:hypothetical protein
MPRTFYSENAGRPFRAGDRVFEFTVTSIVGGTVQGVIEIADGDVDLFLAVAAGKVEEITAEDYAKLLEKKKRIADSSPLPPSSKRPELAIKGAGAVVVDGASVKAPADDKALPTGIDDVIELGVAAPPTTEINPKKERGRALLHAEKRGT